MQQTEKYKLNLIERNDPFSPDALNQNTQKVEDAMAAHEAGIEQRLTVLEAHKIYAGTYAGSQASSTFVPLPFTPRIVIASDVDPSHGGPHCCISVKDQRGHGYLKIQENGFTVTNTLNVPNYTFPFLALA